MESASQQLPHILIVDDDREIRSLLSDYLKRSGYRTSVAAEGKAMKSALDSALVDLVVLDVMLPGDDGLTLCRELRKTSQVPVIMLTALSDNIDRVLGMEVGADDYLTKPFNPRELLVRIKTVLRRTSHPVRLSAASEVRSYRFAEWRLDMMTRELHHADGHATSLSGAEFRLLSILLRHPNRVLSRTQVMAMTRGRDADPFDRSIDVRISRLRQALGDDARAPQIIKTVYGEGYFIGVPVVKDMNGMDTNPSEMT